MFDYQEYRNKYSQHILFYEAGVEDRRSVFQARVAVIGLGAIGIEASRLLAIAQVQLVRFICWGKSGDDDLPAVASSKEAQPQECLPRGLAAVRELAAANPSLVVELRGAADAGDLESMLRDTDLVLYEGDHSQRHSLVGDVCRTLNKPWIYAQADGGSGMTVNVIPGKTACIDCVKNKVKADPAQGLSYLPTVTDLIARTMAQVQAMEALRILGSSPNVSAEVFCFDVDRFGHTLCVPKNEACGRCNR